MTTNQKTIVQIEIAEAGKNAKHAKYVTATTDAGEKVVLARPLRNYEFHADIVSAYQRETGKNLKNISGGYVCKQGESYIFSGSSGSYGAANHKQVSAIVNGTDIKSRARTTKDNFVATVHNDLENLVDGFDTNYYQRELWNKATYTTLFGSLATIAGAYAIKGYFEQDASVDPATIIGVAGLTTVAVSAVAQPMILGSREYSSEGPVSRFASNMLAEGIMGAVAAGVGYIAGLAVKRVTQ